MLNLPFLSREQWMDRSPNETYDFYLAEHMALEATKEALEKVGKGDERL